MAKDEKTVKKAGTAASKVLKSGSTGKDSKTAAGSALSQRPDKSKARRNEAWARVNSRHLLSP